MRRVEVLVPTCERPAALAVTLAGLAGQRKQGFEVIASDQSEAPVSARAEVATMMRVLEHHGRSVRFYHHLPRRGVAENRQFLLERSSSPYVLFLDDDVYLDPDALERLVRTMDEERCGFVGAFPTGLSFTEDRRPEVENLFERWEGPVRPESAAEIEASRERWRLHSAANPMHLHERFGAARYKVAWVGACVLYDRAKLLEAGGFSWWRSLRPHDVGEDVLAQRHLRLRHGGCAILPSGAYHLETVTTLPRRSEAGVKRLLRKPK